MTSEVAPPEVAPPEVATAGPDDRCACTPPGAGPAIEEDRIAGDDVPLQILQEAQDRVDQVRPEDLEGFDEELAADLDTLLQGEYAAMDDRVEAAPPEPRPPIADPSDFVALAEAPPRWLDGIDPTAVPLRQSPPTAAAPSGDPSPGRSQAAPEPLDAPRRRPRTGAVLGRLARSLPLWVPIVWLLAWLILGRR